MYCPQCATANAGEVKFCRSCGTPLEAVALAIGGKSNPISQDKNEPKTPQAWMEKRIEGVSHVTRGIILLSVSLLLAIALGLFLPTSFGAAWIFIWLAFFGWMTMWGASSWRMVSVE